MTLGELRTLLANCKPDAKVRINFGSPTLPTGIESWRGSYDEASMTFGPSHITDEEIDATGVIAMIDDAMSKTHYGYKGGEYTFDRDTRVWIAEHGWSGNCSIDRVIDEGWCVIIQPGYGEY